MQLFLGSIYLLLIVFLQLLLIDHACRRVQAFKRWRQVMRLSALTWFGMALLKKACLDSIFPPGDAILHEAIARDIAELLTAGYFVEAFDYFGFGNPAYRFMLGVFYALTAAPEVVLYAVNGALAFWGMLSLLEVLCQHAGCVRLPAKVVVPCLFLPSGLLWTTANLKEGLVLWGICMMLRLTMPECGGRLLSLRLLPLLGMMVLGLVRPHIAIIWLVSISLLVTWRSRKFGLFVLTSTGALAGVFLLKQAAPTLFEAATGQGVTSTLSERYEHLAANSDQASRHFLDQNPTPVWTGVILILFRPWPWEVRQFGELLAGLEVWLLALLGFWTWFRAPNKRSQLKHSSVISFLVCLVFFGFFFTYMYNMGLVVRQRLMAFPAVWFLYSWPVVSRSSQLARSAFVSRRPATNKLQSHSSRLSIPSARYQGS